MDLLKSVGRESTRLADKLLPAVIKNNLVLAHDYVHGKASPLIARLGQLLGIDESNIKVSIVKIAGITFITVSVLILGSVFNSIRIACNPSFNSRLFLYWLSQKGLAVSKLFCKERHQDA